MAKTSAGKAKAMGCKAKANAKDFISKAVVFKAKAKNFWP